MSLKEIKLKNVTKKELISRTKKSDNDYLDGKCYTQEELEEESKSW